MKNKKYSIVYSSLTGNTKVLADAIHEALPQDECEYFGVSDTVIPSSELLYIGFWTDKGNADTKTLQLLSQLKRYLTTIAIGCKMDYSRCFSI